MPLYEEIHTFVVSILQESPSPTQRHGVETVIYPVKPGSNVVREGCLASVAVVGVTF